MDGEINLFLDQSLLNLFHKEALSPNLRQWSVLNLISCCFYFDQSYFEMGMRLKELLSHPVGLKKGKLASTGAYSKFF